MKRIYGIRGATTVAANTKENIIRETQNLLQTILQKNTIHGDDLVSIIFTTTPDLNAEFPAKAARLMGLGDIPLLGCVESAVPHGLPFCIRLLLYVYLEDGCAVKHIYLNEAGSLRPDLL